VPSVVRAHEEVQKKKTELSKDEYKAWIAKRSKRILSARAHSEKCTKWQKQFKRHYEDDDEIQAREMHENIIARRSQ
jgi:hypothetical protein